MTLQWREQLSVGNDLIDTDHRHLIEIINQAEASLKTNRRADLAVVLDELARYGKTHFDREERVAKAAGYPKSDQLHVSHDQLIEILEKFRGDIGETWPEDAVERFTTFLRDWFINHVIMEDLLMKPWLVKLSPSFVPG